MRNIERSVIGARLSEVLDAGRLQVDELAAASDRRDGTGDSLFGHQPVHQIGSLLKLRGVQPDRLGVARGSGSAPNGLIASSTARDRATAANLDFMPGDGSTGSRATQPPHGAHQRRAGDDVDDEVCA